LEEAIMRAKKPAQFTRMKKGARSQRAPAKPVIQEPSRKRPAAWGVLVYLAGDVEDGYEAIRDDLAEILKEGGSADLRIVVQFDGPDGARRFIVPSKPAPDLQPVQSLGRIDSGGTAALLDFLRWGLSVCDSERLALVLGSPISISPAYADLHPNPDSGSVFSLSYDQGSGNFLDVSALGGVIREALNEARRGEIELLALDSCHVQFLELAYELEDLVHVLIAPQTDIPIRGWDYRRVLSSWKTLAAERKPPLSVPQLACELLKEIFACYHDKKGARAVSALDLQRLDDVARAFDTLCIGTLQCLGEGLIWETRSLLLRHFAEMSAGPVYDCGSFFAV
jgi:Clostripain family